MQPDITVSVTSLASTLTGRSVVWTYLRKVPTANDVSLKRRIYWELFFSLTTSWRMPA